MSVTETIKNLDEMRAIVLGNIDGFLITMAFFPKLLQSGFYSVTSFPDWSTFLLDHL